VPRKQYCTPKSMITLFSILSFVLTVLTPLFSQATYNPLPLAYVKVNYLDRYHFGWIADSVPLYFARIAHYIGHCQPDAPHAGTNERSGA